MAYWSASSLHCHTAQIRQEHKAMTTTTPPTETPRTDAAMSAREGNWMNEMVSADFARELERELQLCLAKNTEYQADVIRIAGELILLRQELESQRPRGYLKQEQVTAYLLHWREYWGKLETQIVERDVNISILTKRLHAAEALLKQVLEFNDLTQIREAVRQHLTTKPTP